MTNAFPPLPRGQTTLADWLQHPKSHWGLQHMREVVPTALVERDPERHWRLPARLRDLTRLSFERYGGEGPTTLGEWLRDAHVDGLLVLRQGEIVTEYYANGLTPTRTHLVFSVTKSVTGLVLGTLASEGRLDPDAPVARYVPEVADSGFGDATVRQALDMAVSLDYDEVYDDPKSMMVRLRDSVGWRPPLDPLKLGDVRSFLASIGRRAGPHGKHFRYLTPNSELLGWIAERAGGEPFASLITRAIWRPMGAECSADISVDRLGLARSGGGFAATLRDLGRLVETVRCQGRAEGRQILPAAWIEDIMTKGDPAAWAGSAFDYMWPGDRAAYRSQWYLSDERGSKFAAAGIHGQWLWCDRDSGVCVVKLASRPEPSSVNPGMHDMACFDAIAAAL